MSAALRPLTCEEVDWAGHAGQRIGHANGYDIIACHRCAFRHAMPLPSADVAAAQYATDYYGAVKPTYLEHASEDRIWSKLAETDRLFALEDVLGRVGGTLIEIGSGPGFFLETACERGWSAIGVEPSIQAAAFAQQRGLVVHNRTFADALAHGLPQADAVVATNVLEHVADPISLMQSAIGLLKPGGVACLTVPNDFSSMQSAARTGQDHTPWWISPPHHLNYFDFDSLEALACRLGLRPLHRMTSFPMEAFLLMGEDYVRTPENGRVCHERRKRFDLTFEAAGMSEVRRKLYGALAAVGIGREATVLAVKP